MSTSEIMTIVICFHQSNHRDFKNFYTGFVARYWHNYFPNLLSYTRFLELMPTALVPLCSYFSSLKGKPTGIAFVDSTSIKVCHNIRIPRHRVFDGVKRLCCSCLNQSEVELTKGSNSFLSHDVLSGKSKSFLPQNVFQQAYTSIHNSGILPTFPYAWASMHLDNLTSLIF